MMPTLLHAWASQRDGYVRPVKLALSSQDAWLEVERHGARLHERMVACLLVEKSIVTQHKTIISVDFRKTIKGNNK